MEAGEGREKGVACRLRARPQSQTDKRCVRLGELWPLLFYFCLPTEAGLVTHSRAGVCCLLLAAFARRA